MNPLCIVTLTLTLAALVSGHGYVRHPPSRSYLCKINANQDCGDAHNRPEYVEGPKAWPQGGWPLDGKIASCGMPPFLKLDEFGGNRWSVPRIKFHRVDDNLVSLQMVWTLVAPHPTTGFRVFLSNGNYDPNRPLTRDVFNLQPACVRRTCGRWLRNEYKYTCRFHKSQLDVMTRKPGVMLAIWDMKDTLNGFFQVIDLIAEY